MRSKCYSDFTYKILLFSFFFTQLLNIFFHFIFDDFNNNEYEDLGGVVPTFSLALFTLLFVSSNALVYKKYQLLPKPEIKHYLPFIRHRIFLKKFDDAINPRLAEGLTKLAMLSINFMILFDANAIDQRKSINESATIAGLIVNNLANFIYFITTHWASTQDYLEFSETNHPIVSV